MISAASILDWASLGLGAASLGAWLYLAFFHGDFWRIEPEHPLEDPISWPAVTAIIPARNEAVGIAETLQSLFRQEGGAGVQVIVVDDHSTDGTSDVARQAAADVSAERRLTVLNAPPLPPGWAGKVWAMHQGYLHCLSQPQRPEFVLFCDADIHHAPDALRRLTGAAVRHRLGLTSWMVRLVCRTPAERLMIPAFVYFFRLLYPFRWVSDPRRETAGAAGGTMLVRFEALEKIGGMESLQDAVIDDCALARAIQAAGYRLHLSLARVSRSTRGYASMAEVIQMIARTAYTQLGYSPVALIGSVLGLAFVFLTPPALALLGTDRARGFGAAAWLLQAASYLPMVRFYGNSPGEALLLPVTATLYLYATLLSAWRHHRGIGGQWKGRHQSEAVRSRRNTIG